MHHSKCTPAGVLSLPISLFLFILLLLSLLLLFPTQPFTNRSCFCFLVEKRCHIPLAVIHQHRVKLFTVGGLYPAGGGTFLFSTDGKSCVYQLGSIHTGGLLVQLIIGLCVR